MTFVANSTPTLVKQPRVGVVQIANADASNWKTVVTAGANGSKVTDLIASSTELTANNRDVQVAITRSAVHYILGTTTVPFSAGFTVAAGAPIDLLAIIPNLPVDQDGQKYLFLESGDTLDISSTTTLTSGKVISAAAIYGDF